MDNSRVDDLLVFALAAAAREDADRFGRRELGPIHLVKYVYLADLAYASTHGGTTYSGAPWRFHHFGPWATQVWERIEPVAGQIGARRRVFTSTKTNDDSVRFELSHEGESRFDRLQRDLPWEVTSAIKRWVHEFGADTTALLREVYLTKPMLRAAPGEGLVFEGEEAALPQLEDDREHAQPQPSARQRREMKAALEALRVRVRARKTERAASRRQVAPDPPPPYDEVFARGVAWLDSEAGEPPCELQAEGVFADEVWKSGARRGSEVP